jgi:DNA polymerase I-like protein with 3'-5' exonuclease and polymerase domains
VLNLGASSSLSGTPVDAPPACHGPGVESFYFKFNVVDTEALEVARSIVGNVRPSSLGMEGFNCHYVTSVAAASALVDTLQSITHPVGFDFETRGWQPRVKVPGIMGGSVLTELSPLHPALRAMPVTFQVSWGLDAYVVSGSLLYLFGSWLSGDNKIDFANEHFEGKVFENVGLPFSRAYRDCIAMDFLLEETLRQRSHGLKKLVLDYLGIQMESFESSFRDSDFETVLSTDPETALKYAGLDALVTTLVCDVLEHHLENRSAREGYSSFELYMRWERPYHSSIRRMQCAGVPVNREQIMSYHAALTDEITQIDEESYSRVGLLNLSSNKALAKYYYGVMKKPVARTTDGYTCILCNKKVTSRTDNRCNVHGRGALVNSPALDDEVLGLFARDGDELAALVQRRRTLDKKRSTWVDGFYRLSTEDGWGYPTIRSTFVVSGRLTGGAWLTTPGDLRRIFTVPEGSNLSFLRLDYSQLELRVLAHVANDPTMLSAFRTNKDLHCWAAGLLRLLREHGEASVNNEELREQYYQEVHAAKEASDNNVTLTDRQVALLADRQDAKSVNFGIAYGMGEESFARQKGCTREEAAAIFDAVWAMYAAVPQYYEDSIKTTREAGELKTLLGRNRKIPELNSSDPSKRSYGERLVKNTPCQAGGADVIRAAMILCDMDVEAGGTYGSVGYGAYGRWVEGAWQPTWSHLPKKWESDGLPPSFLEAPGLLGRLGFKMVLQVHDELLFVGPTANVEEAGARVKRLMEEPFGAELTLRVPLSVSVGFGASWDEAK